MIGRRVIYRICTLLIVSATGIVSPPAHAQGVSLPCQPLADVKGSSPPAFDPFSPVAVLIIGERYWACPCGESRRLAGDTETRSIAGDTEQRRVVGDTEQRRVAGDTEQRRLAGDMERRQIAGNTEQRALAGDTERRQVVGDTEQRRLAGDAGAIACRRPVPSCEGFALTGVSAPDVKVLGRGGFKATRAACVAPE